MADQEKEEEQEVQQPPFTSMPMSGQNQPPLTDEKMMPQNDGAIPQNAEGITSGQYDALDPTGNAEIKFQQGNYQTMQGLPKVVNDKVAQLIQTFVPLIEISLIELMGSNNLYQRQLAQCMPSFDNQGKMGIEFTFIYVVDQWIGQDIPLESIQHDSQYVLDRIKPAGGDISRCEIDVGNGTLTIQGSI